MCATNPPTLSKHGLDTLPRGWTKHLAVYQLFNANMVCCCLLTLAFSLIILFSIPEEALSMALKRFLAIGGFVAAAAGFSPQNVSPMCRLIKNTTSQSIYSSTAGVIEWEHVGTSTVSTNRGVSITSTLMATPARVEVAQL